MKRQDTPLSTRIASAFENGSGDEGLLAKAIYYVVMSFLVIIGVVFYIIAAPLYLIGRAKKYLQNRRKPTAASRTNSAS